MLASESVASAPAVLPVQAEQLVMHTAAVLAVAAARCRLAVALEAEPGKPVALAVDTAAVERNILAELVAPPAVVAVAAAVVVVALVVALALPAAESIEPADIEVALTDSSAGTAPAMPEAALVVIATEWFGVALAERRFEPDPVRQM